MEYYEFYIQKESEGSAVKDTVEDFGMYEVQSKFYGGREVKEPARREWRDEDGDDEFVPSSPVFKAQEMEIKFAYKGAMSSANDKLEAFIKYLSEGGTMKTYDSYNRIGRRNVRFVSVSDDAELVRDSVDGDILVFTVKLKVNDPVTDIKLQKD